ncbi:hypothetical protein ACFUNF_34955 [Streptomyces sp. NPDC057291]|uniref:hypothetical protein n=1 Tax=Streptomyces sp. NPDC057291 TaxID=3346087 RepID=UPI0036346AE9
MDLPFLMNNRARTVIEVSGRRHYPDVEADAAVHAETMAEDREPTMQDYGLPDRRSRPARGVGESVT